MFKTKAEINQSITLEKEDLDSLQKVAGNVYIVNKNNGSVNVQVNFSEAIMGRYKENVGLLAIMEQVKQLLITFALADSKNVTSAAKKLKISEATLRYHLKTRKGLKTKYNHPLLCEPE